jgi:hypothetical protein
MLVYSYHLLLNTVFTYLIDEYCNLEVVDRDVLASK